MKFDKQDGELRVLLEDWSKVLLRPNHPVTLSAGSSIKRPARDPKGIVDLAAIFDAENSASGNASVKTLNAQSAIKRQFRDAKGNVDLAAVFDEEAEANGLQPKTQN